MRLKTFTVGSVCPALLLVAGSAFAGEPAWELAPPDAKVLVGLDIRALRNSPVMDVFAADAKSNFQKTVKEIEPMGPFPIPKFDLFEDIDSVFLASNAEKVAPRPVTDKVESTTPATPAAKANPSFLLAVAGTFPDEHLRPLLKGPHPSYKGINVYRGTGPNPMAVAVLDEHLFVLGDEKSIYRAIDRRTTGIKPEGPVFARAKELAASNDVWIVVRDVAGDIKKAAGPTAAFASEVEGLDVGLAVRDAFNLDLRLATKTEAGAQMFAQLLSSQLQMGIASKLDDQAAAEALKHIKLGANGKSMQIQVALTKEELIENIRMMREQSGKEPARLASRPNAFGNPTPALPTTQNAVAVVPSQPPAPPKPRVVKIYGLDDGTKEITLEKTN